MRIAWIACVFLLTTCLARAVAPRAVCLAAGGERTLYALADGKLQHMRLSSGNPAELPLTAPGITTLAVGRLHGTLTLLGARGRELVCLDRAKAAWRRLGLLPEAIREIHPLPGAAEGALLLTGASADPAVCAGAIYRARWERRFTCSRVTVVEREFRPWQLWWTQVAGEQRFAAATYKATPMLPFRHRCMFVYAWDGHTAEPRWLGSRLSRPYVDATHANLRGDGAWRMVAVEETADGRRALSVYQPIGFGYEGEWRSDVVPGLQRVVACGPAVICWGRTADGTPCAWQLLPETDGYRLAPLSAAPPTPEAVAQADATRLGGWWDGEWRFIPLATP